jgi:hypothetical protein
VTTSVQLKWSLLNASSGWLLDFSRLQAGKRPTVEVEKRMVQTTADGARCLMTVRTEEASCRLAGCAA